MERDFAVRFSDDTYATKDDVKKALAMSSIDSVWEKICAYRNYFRKDLDLVTVERKIFFVCLTSPMQKRITSTERRLTKLMLQLDHADETYRQYLLELSLLEIARSYARVNSLTVEDDILLDLINGRMTEIPQAYLSLKNYLSTIQFYLCRTANRYGLSVLTSFYGKMLRKEIDPDDFESYARLVDHNNPADHVLFGRHYNAAPLDRIEELLGDLMRFNAGDSLFVLVRAIVTYFYLVYIKPFDYFNEECALLSLKYIIAHDDMDRIPFLLNLEDVLLNLSGDLLNQKLLLSEMTCDLTYAANYILDVIDAAVDQFQERISDDEIHQIKQEFVRADEPRLKKTSEAERNSPFSNPVVFEQKVSMPTLPVGLDERDIDLIAENLLELYPTLKRMQAKFYAGHCTIGKYYSIAQYKKETGVAYETARTSMDNLVHLGFYKKEQVKNKYVYTPVVR